MYLVSLCFMEVGPARRNVPIGVPLAFNTSAKDWTTTWYSNCHFGFGLIDEEDVEADTAFQNYHHAL